MAKRFEFAKCRDEEWYCPKCKIKLDYNSSDDTYVCGMCGWVGEYSSDYDGKGKEVISQIENYFTPDDAGSNSMPPCCVACGCGAYPDCITSCKIFDD